MVIKDPKDVPIKKMSDYKGITKQVYIGPEDGSNEIVMRYFSVEPGCSTPYHDHNFPHVVKVEKGLGVLVDKDKNEQELTPGKLVYVHDDEVHCFRNTGNDSFDFICIVPIRGEIK